MTASPQDPASDPAAPGLQSDPPTVEYLSESTPSGPHVSDVHDTDGIVGTPVDTVLPPQFGPYRVVRLLGKGGMGHVYLVKDARLDREEALKVPLFAVDDEPEILQRFVREARAAAAISHPNVCQVYDAGEIDGVYYMTMAYIEGKSLADQMRSSGPFPQTKAALLVRKVALAMQHAHELGLIHRDLKPSNIMINSQGEPVVMDFGLARRTGKERSRITRTGMVMGTPSYMAPEQLAGEVDKLGPGCDIYSLGVVLYELLTLERPFSGDMIAIASKIALEPPPPPSQFRSDLDPMLEAICLKAMEKQIERRHRSMAEFAHELGKYLRFKTRRAAATEAAAGDASPTPATPKTPRASAVVTPGGDAPRSATTKAAQASARSTWYRLGAAVVLLLVLVAVLSIVNPSDSPTDPERADRVQAPDVDQSKAITPTRSVSVTLPGTPSPDESSSATGRTQGNQGPSQFPDASTSSATKGGPMPQSSSIDGPKTIFPKVVFPGVTRGTNVQPPTNPDAAKASAATEKDAAKTQKDSKAKDEANVKTARQNEAAARSKIILARKYLRDGDKLAAIDQLRQAIELAPGSKPSAEAQKLLDENK
jgi:predicted Ser/Thr protein kinase